MALQQGTGRQSPEPGAGGALDVAEPAGARVSLGVEFARHDGVALLGDLFQPAAPGSYPGLVMIHGGGWQGGTRTSYQHWGAYLAQHGYVVFSVDYRLATPEQAAYPQNVLDTKAAVQYLRGEGAALDVDPARIGVMGSSAGGHLAAFLALTGDEPHFANAYPDDPHAGASTRLSACVPVYGAYDLRVQGKRDQAPGRAASPVVTYLGGTPVERADTYREASPITWVAAERGQTPFLVVWGTTDPVVDYVTQALPFVVALERAGYPVRTVPVEGAAHFWFSETPVEQPGSYTAYLAPHVLQFLGEHL